MSKRLILLLALAFVVGISFAAYAEVQNVKVSGDIAVKGVARDNFDLTKTSVAGSVTGSNRYDDKNSDLLSITRVRVDADLTDNVATTVRLLNERNWNGQSNVAGTNNRNIGLNGANDVSDEDDITLDLAYVTLKEFLYSPLSLTVGRQELRFGTGLVVGDPDTNIYSVRTALAEGDLSSRKAFDAIKITLDYNPLLITGIYAKIEEGNNAATNGLNDDVNLAGINASYELDKDTTLEGFFFSKLKESNAAAVTNRDAGLTTSFTGGTAAAPITPAIKDVADKVHTVGARIVNKTLKNLTIDAQAAYQFGTYNPKFDPNARYISGTVKKETSGRDAWAAQVEATYDLKDIALLSKYKPSITGNYTYLSGADRDQTGNKAYKGWDTMFEDQTYGHIMNAIIADTNMHRVALLTKAKLTDDVALNLDYVIARFAKEYSDQKLAILSGVSTARQFRMGKSAYIGQEIDATLTYDYTEDVQFSLLGGIFLPSKNVNGNTDSTDNVRAAATELIGSMKVTF